MRNWRLRDFLAIAAGQRYPSSSRYSGTWRALSTKPPTTATLSITSDRSGNPERERLPNIETACRLGRTKRPNTSAFIAAGRIQPATSDHPPERIPLAISLTLNPPTQIGPSH
jgi:hypothetical protein